MAIRDNERFHAVVIQGPDAFTDAVLTAEGLASGIEKQMRRALNTFVSARFDQWETESGAEQIAAHEPPLPLAMSDIRTLRTLDLPPAPGSGGGW